MFTCIFAADEGSLSVFQHVNSLAMHLNMSLRLPGSPQSLPDSTVAHKAELQALIPHTRRLKQGTNTDWIYKCIAFFLFIFFSMILIEVPVYGTEIQKD